MINAFNFLSSDTYNIKQQKMEINPKKKDVIAWMVVIKYLKSSGDDLLLQKSCSDLSDHIFETKSDENVAIFRVLHLVECLGVLGTQL